LRHTAQGFSSEPGSAPITEDVITGSREGREGGFTLVEMMVALLVLAIVLAAVAPAFWGSLKATASSDQRSVADGLAVAASEQIRSLPYYEVGYSTTPSYCDSASDPVLLTYSTPMDSLPTLQTIRGTKYEIQTCIYWVTASDGDTQAYKQSVVNILWGSSDQYKYSQTSALYPGGESSYTSPGADNFIPTTTVASSGGSAPSPPVANSASPYTTSQTDTLTPQSTINVNWNVDNYTSPVLYNIEYWTGSSTRPSNPTLANSKPVSGSPDANTAGTLDYQVGGLSAATTYYFDVVAVSGSSSSLPSNVVSATTYTSSGGACTVGSITVSPSNPMVDKNGAAVGWSSLSITVNSTCDDISVEYGIENSQGVPQAPLTAVPMSNNGSWTGSASQSSWSVTTYGFVVYQNGSEYLPEAIQNVTFCKESGSSGHC
jgi:prepilin-type N-terminal cleavage/methylation domain-containing protein